MELPIFLDIRLLSSISPTFLAALLCPSGSPYQPSSMKRNDFRKYLAYVKEQRYTTIEQENGLSDEYEIIFLLPICK